jgi:hypothetical protein
MGSAVQTSWTQGPYGCGDGRSADTEVVGDGAPWIWNLALDQFYGSLQVVDWYHATEHLAKAARLLKDEGSLAEKRWYNARETTLFEGHAARIAQELEAVSQNRPSVAEGLEKEAGYFRKNKRRMNYQEMREEGWAIGSGMVESAAKQFKARFAGPGMHWNRSGAERLIPVRVAIMSNRFDELWHTVYNSPPNWNAPHQQGNRILTQQRLMAMVFGTLAALGHANSVHLLKEDRQIPVASADSPAQSQNLAIPDEQTI